MDCLENAMNLLMTFYSVMVVEHYMIFLLISKAGSDEIQDQLLNTLRDHLHKEDSMLRNMEGTMICLGNDTTMAFKDFLKNVHDGISLTDDPEFISNYINNFDNTIKDIVRYMLIHDEIMSRIIAALRIKIHAYLKNLT
ncbi:hypothetical protein [Vulcanisaeta souniana]|nr:hypothetical protein [Vulcanisaeta souniana]